MDVHTLLESHASLKRRNELIQEMNELGLRIARYMKKNTPILSRSALILGWTGK